MKSIRKSVFLLIATTLFLPSFQSFFNIFEFYPLKGTFTIVPRPEFSMKTWMNGDYQEQARQNINDHTGFRSVFVRFFNQVDYSLFSIAHANRVVVGKKGYLYEERYINGVLGRDFIGNAVIDLRAKQLRELQDKLWDRKHILLLVLFPPDKGTFYEEYIPDRYLTKPKQLSNYLRNKEKLEENHVNFIDFNAWFLKIKDTSRYVLYPKTGIHWSSYGAFLAADSLAGYLEGKLKQRFAHPLCDSIHLSRRPLDRDADLEEIMNLKFKIPSPEMAYPFVHYDKQAGSAKPSALFVGDSFYFIWANAGYIDNMFNNNEFWYYNHDVFNGTVNTGKKVAQLNILDEISRQNILVIMQANAGYGIVGYNLVDGLLNALDSAENVANSNSER